MSLEREVLTTVAHAYMEKYHKMVGVSTFLIVYWSKNLMTEGIKHTRCGLHSDHGAATLTQILKAVRSCKKLQVNEIYMVHGSSICVTEGHIVRTKPRLYEYQELMGTLWRPT